MKNQTLSPPEFSIFSTLVEERCGLAYRLADKAIFESKLWARALDAGFDSALDYYYFLRYDDPDGREWTALLHALLVHETYFFRELDGLRTAVEQVIKPRLEAGHAPRIWCSASSTGEEPLSLAMLLASTGLLSRVQIVATDLSHDALARARSGKFGPRAVRSACPVWARPFLSEQDGGFVVAPALLEAIAWRRLNLVDASAVNALPEQDLILCRNVLIYFRDETARKVVHSLKARLAPGGVLLVGVSESLLRLDTGLACEEHAGAFLYRKVER
jgi:chemotaxis protein methyltransferase CheR